jgi:hypothetical protein
VKDVIAEQFGVMPIPIKREVTPKTKEIKDDFDTARQNLHSIIAKGGEALDNLLQLADQSQSDRYYKVVSETINSLVNANRELLGLQKTIKEIGNDNNGPKHVQNNLYVGSSADLLRMIKGEGDKQS